MGEFKQAWADAWQRSPLIRFWNLQWARRMFLAGVGLFCLGMLACVVQWAFNGHVKAGKLYNITAAMAYIGDLVLMLSVILFCIVDVGGDIIRFIKNRKRP
jgi:hypothetical protein